MKTQILLTKTAILHTVITGFLLVTALNAGVHIKWTFVFNLIIIPILALILMGIDILVASKYKHNATKAEIISLRIKSPLLFFRSSINNNIFSQRHLYFPHCNSRCYNCRYIDNI